MVAVITGASGGIGSAAARMFAEAGYEVALCYNESKEEAEKLYNELVGAEDRAELFQADLSKPEEVHRLFEEIHEKLGNVEVLVNNAGTASQGLLQDVTDDEYDRIMDTNMRSTFLCCREVLPEMISRRSGSILNISSMWGQVGGSTEVVYSAAKAAVIGFTKALAKEVGPSNIRVNCIAPGVIDTKMNSFHTSETMQALADETPLERIGMPEDIAYAALFLCSEGADFITGQVLGINGGMVI